MIYGNLPGIVWFKRRTKFFSLSGILMKLFKHIPVAALLILATWLAFPGAVRAQSPGGKEFGFGLILGEPSGGTVKLWLNKVNALTANIGASYFGSPRIGVDYLWHFNAFNSRIVNLYAGPGVALGIGSGKGFWYKENNGKFYVRESGETGVAVRAMLGLNIVPSNTPIEIFVELGPLIGITPDFGSAFDAAIGIRFYP